MFLIDLWKYNITANLKCRYILTLSSNKARKKVVECKCWWELVLVEKVGDDVGEVVTLFCCLLGTFHNFDIFIIVEPFPKYTTTNDLVHIFISPPPTQFITKMKLCIINRKVIFVWGMFKQGHTWRRKIAGKHACNLYHQILGFIPWIIRIICPIYSISYNLSHISRDLIK